MSDKILAQLKKVQSDIILTKNLPEPVVKIQKDVQTINQFVQTLLKKENSLVFSKDVQVNTLTGLVEVNRIFSKLARLGKSENHYLLNRSQIDHSIESINDLIFCIKQTIENGFYEVEPRGFRLFQSIVISWSEISELYKKVNSSHEISMLFPAFQDQQFKKTIHELYSSLLPHAEAVLKFKKSKELTHQFTLEEIKVVNRYFKGVKVLYQYIDQQHLNPNANQSIPDKVDIETIDQVVKELQNLEQIIHQYSPKIESLLLVDELHFDENTLNDLTSRLSFVYIGMESSRVLAERFKTLKNIQTNGAQVTEIDQFIKTIEFEKKQIQFFTINLLKNYESLLVVESLLANLSISFGKIYRLSLKNDLTRQFTERTLDTVNTLLSKGIKFLEKRGEDSKTLHQVLKKTTVFQKTIEGVIISAFRELEESKHLIQTYQKRLQEKTKNGVEANQAEINFILKEIYDDRTELTIAAIRLNNMCQNFKLIVQELKAISATYDQLEIKELTETNSKAMVDINMEILKENAQCSPLLMRELWVSAQDLHWLIEEIHLKELKELRRFEEELKSYFAPVKQRIEDRQAQKRLRETQEKEDAIKASKQKQKPVEQVESKEKDLLPMERLAKKKDVPLGKIKEHKSAPNPYDPYQPNIMVLLKKVCSDIGSDRLIMAKELLDRPHTFFNFLSHLEEEYDPKTLYTEALWRTELMESETTMDFFLGFVKMKFMPHGYYDANGTKITFNPETSKFEYPSDSELFLRISNHSLEPPKVIFTRLISIVLGYEDVEVLNPEENSEAIGLLKMQFIVKEEEKEGLHIRVASVS